MPERKSATIQDAEVGKAELVYTSSAAEDGTFFCQLNKYPNEELLEFNNRANQVVGELIETHKVKRLDIGQVVLARYAEDGAWYRARILDKDNKKKVSVLQFVDYGNFEVTNYDQILSLDDVDDLKRPPFGIVCHYAYIDRLDEIKREKFYNVLANRYLLLRLVDKQVGEKGTVYKVDIPKLAYNLHFWELFEGKRIKKRRETLIHEIVVSE